MGVGSARSTLAPLVMRRSAGVNGFAATALTPARGLLLPRLSFSPGSDLLERQPGSATQARLPRRDVTTPADMAPQLRRMALRASQCQSEFPTGKRHPASASAATTDDHRSPAWAGAAWAAARQWPQCVRRPSYWVTRARAPPVELVLD